VSNSIDENNEGGESEMEYGHIGISMERIQEKIIEFITEAQKETRVLIDQSIDSLNTSLSTKIDSNHNNIRDELRSNVETINKGFEAYKIEAEKEVVMLEQKMHEHEQELNDFIQEQKIGRRKDKDDISSYMYKIELMTKDNIGNIQSLQICVFNENEYLNQVLSMQDEEDRHSIALWGLKSSADPDKLKRRLLLESNQFSDDTNVMKLSHTPSLFKARDGSSEKKPFDLNIPSTMKALKQKLSNKDFSSRFERKNHNQSMN